MTDLISRQAAIDAIRRYCIDNQIEDGDYHSDGIEYELNNLPSAEPEPKRGRWIDDNCSECGQYVYHGDAINYCPNCGADMREREDER